MNSDLPQHHRCTFLGRLTAAILAVGVSALTAQATTTVITSGSVYRVFDMNSLQVLELPGSSTADGTLLVQAPSNETPTQYWKAVAVGSYWKFIDVNSGKAMSVVGGSTTSGADIDQYTDNGSLPQNWTLTAVGDGSYKIINRNSGMLVQVAGSSTASHAEVNQRPDNGTATQHWAFEEVAAGGAYPRVYIGGGDNAPGAFNGYLGDPSHWTYVRANADGYYINNFALDTNVNDTTQNNNLKTMAGLFSHKNVFYETDAVRATGSDDEAKIDILRVNFNVSYATINEGTPADRVADLQWREWRPVLAMIAPWEVGGNFNNSSNSTAQSEVLGTWGSTTDGPSGYFRDNQGGMQGGCYSLVQYTKDNGLLSELMIATYTSGTNSGTAAANGAAFLSAGQTMVRDCENNGASPDIWAISYYAAQLQVYAVTPESNSDGSAAGTVTGLGYWLIHHLRDPAHWAKLEALPDPDATVKEPAAPSANPASAEQLIADAKCAEEKQINVTLPEKGDQPISKTLRYRLHNDSSWLDLCPAIQARIDDREHHWDVRATLDGKDVTAALTKGGLVCAKDFRLWPGQSREIQITLTCRDETTSPVDVHLALLPHPTEPLLARDRIALHAAPAADTLVALK